MQPILSEPLNGDIGSLDPNFNKKIGFLSIIIVLVLLLPLYLIRKSTSHRLAAEAATMTVMICQK